MARKRRIVEHNHLFLKKGNAVLQGKGQLQLDDNRRPQGIFDVAASPFKGLLGNLITSAQMAYWLGNSKKPNDPQQAAPPLSSSTDKNPLSPLPPIKIERGRLLIGALAVPGIMLAPLY
jgi:hypothetical protein